MSEVQLKQSIKSQDQEEEEEIQSKKSLEKLNLKKKETSIQEEDEQNLNLVRIYDLFNLLDKKGQGFIRLKPLLTIYQIFGDKKERNRMTLAQLIQQNQDNQNNSVNQQSIQLDSNKDQKNEILDSLGQNQDKNDTESKKLEDNIKVIQDIKSLEQSEKKQQQDMDDQLSEDHAKLLTLKKSSSTKKQTLKLNQTLNHKTLEEINLKKEGALECYNFQKFYHKVLEEFQILKKTEKNLNNFIFQLWKQYLQQKGGVKYKCCLDSQLKKRQEKAEFDFLSQGGNTCLTRKEAVEAYDLYMLLDVDCKQQLSVTDPFFKVNQKDGICIILDEDISYIVELLRAYYKKNYVKEMYGDYGIKIFFREFDKDFNGFIDLSEFREGLNNSDLLDFCSSHLDIISITDSLVVKKLFDKFTKEEGGDDYLLTFEEFRCVIQNTEHQPYITPLLDNLKIHFNRHPDKQKFLNKEIQYKDQMNLEEFEDFLENKLSAYQCLNQNEYKYLFDFFREDQPLITIKFLFIHITMSHLDLAILKEKINNYIKPKEMKIQKFLKEIVEKTEFENAEDINEDRTSLYLKDLYTILDLIKYELTKQQKLELFFFIDYNNNREIEFTTFTDSVMKQNYQISIEKTMANLRREMIQSQDGVNIEAKLQKIQNSQKETISQDQFITAIQETSATTNITEIRALYKFFYKEKSRDQEEQDQQKAKFDEQFEDEIQEESKNEKNSHHNKNINEEHDKKLEHNNVKTEHKNKNKKIILKFQLHDFLVSLKTSKSKLNEIQYRLKELKQRIHCPLKNLFAVFAQYPKDQKKKIENKFMDINDFDQMLQAFDLYFSEQDIKEAFQAFEQDNQKDGKIHYKEFKQVIRQNKPNVNINLEIMQYQQKNFLKQRKTKWKHNLFKSLVQILQENNFSKIDIKIADQIVGQYKFSNPIIDIQQFYRIVKKNLKYKPFYKGQENLRVITDQYYKTQIFPKIPNVLANYFLKLRHNSAFNRFKLVKFNLNQELLKVQEKINNNLPFKWELNENTLQDYKIIKNKNVQERQQKIEESQSKNMLTAIVSLVMLGLDIFDYVSDFIVLNQMYQIATTVEKNGSYMAFTIILLMAELAPYLIAYSSGLQLWLNKGYFDPKKTTSCLSKFKKYMFMSPIGPFLFVFYHFLDIFMELAQVLLLPLSNDNYLKATKCIKSLPKFFGIDYSDFNGLKFQKRMTQLMFETVPILLMNILLWLNIFNSDQIDGFSDLIELAIISAAFKIIKELIILYDQSRHLQESFINYALIGIKAKFGWIPFQTIIDQQRLQYPVNFNYICLPTLGVARLIGEYEMIQFQFTDINLDSLSQTIFNFPEYSQQNDQGEYKDDSDIEEEREEYLKNQSLSLRKKSMKSQQKKKKFSPKDITNLISNKQKKKKLKKVLHVPKFPMKIKIENCTDEISLLQLLKFIRNAMDKQNVIICDYGTIDWALKIKQENLKDNEYDGILPWGESILHLCIDNEANSEDEFPLKVLLRKIYPKLKNKDVVNQFNENCVYYAVTKNKRQCFDILLNELNANYKFPVKTTVFGQQRIDFCLSYIINQGLVYDYEELTDQERKEKDENQEKRKEILENFEYKVQKACEIKNHYFNQILKKCQGQDFQLMCNDRWKKSTTVLGYFIQTCYRRNFLLNKKNFEVFLQLQNKFNFKLTKSEQQQLVRLLISLYMQIFQSELSEKQYYLDIQDRIAQKKREKMLKEKKKQEKKQKKMENQEEDQDDEEEEDDDDEEEETIEEYIQNKEQNDPYKHEKKRNPMFVNREIIQKYIQKIMAIIEEQNINVKEMIDENKNSLFQVYMEGYIKRKSQEVNQIKDIQRTKKEIESWLEKKKKCEIQQQQIKNNQEIVGVKLNPQDYEEENQPQLRSYAYVLQDHNPIKHFQSIFLLKQVELQKLAQQENQYNSNLLLFTIIYDRSNNAISKDTFREIQSLGCDFGEIGSRQVRLYLWFTLTGIQQESKSFYQQILDIENDYDRETELEQQAKEQNENYSRELSFEEKQSQIEDLKQQKKQQEEFDIFIIQYWIDVFDFMTEQELQELVTQLGKIMKQNLIINMIKDKFKLDKQLATLKEVTKNPNAQLDKFQIPVNELEVWKKTEIFFKSLIDQKYQKLFQVSFFQEITPEYLEECYKKGEEILQEELLEVTLEKKICELRGEDYEKMKKKEQNDDYEDEENQDEGESSSDEEDNKVKEKFRKQAKSLGETVGSLLHQIFEAGLEFFALFDLVTDFYIFIKLTQSEHAGWAALSLLCMLTPYFIIYAPMVTLLMKRKVFEKNFGELIGLCFLSIVSLLFIFLIDALTTIFQAIALVISILLLYPCRGKNFIQVEDSIDSIFKNSFSLNSMDVKGIKRQRSLSQLIFESIPQIILQLRILQVINSESNSAFTITTQEILSSVLLAIGHTIIEMALFLLEAKSFKSTFIYYTSICLNGRPNWVPFIEKFQRDTGDDNEDEKEKLAKKEKKIQQIHALSSQQDQKEDVENQNQGENDPLLQIAVPESDKNYDYENIQFKFCGMVTQLEYIFYNETIEQLTFAISSFPKEEKLYSKNSKGGNYVKLHLDHSINKNVTFDKFYAFWNVCKSRIYFTYYDVDLKQLISNSLEEMNKIKEEQGSHSYEIHENESDDDNEDDDNFKDNQKALEELNIKNGIYYVQKFNTDKQFKKMKKQFDQVAGKYAYMIRELYDFEIEKKKVRPMDFNNIFALKVLFMSLSYNNEYQQMNIDDQDLKLMINLLREVDEEHPDFIQLKIYFENITTLQITMSEHKPKIFKNYDVLYHLFKYIKKLDSFSITLNYFEKNHYEKDKDKERCYNQNKYLQKLLKQMEQLPCFQSLKSFYITLYDVQIKDPNNTLKTISHAANFLKNAKQLEVLDFTMSYVECEQESWVLDILNTSVIHSNHIKRINIQWEYITKLSPESFSGLGQFLSTCTNIEVLNLNFRGTKINRKGFQACLQNQQEKISEFRNLKQLMINMAESSVKQGRLAVLNDFIQKNQSIRSFEFDVSYNDKFFELQQNEDSQAFSQCLKQFKNLQDFYLLFTNVELQDDPVTQNLAENLKILFLNNNLKKIDIRFNDGKFEDKTIKPIFQGLLDASTKLNQSLIHLHIETTYCENITDDIGVLIGQIIQKCPDLLYLNFTGYCCKFYDKTLKQLIDGSLSILDNKNIQNLQNYGYNREKRENYKKSVQIDVSDQTEYFSDVVRKQADDWENKYSRISGSNNIEFYVYY